MVTQRLRWTEGLRFEGQDADGHRLRIGGGREHGAKASDLLPISLAACTMHDVVSILRKQRQDLRGLEVEIESEQDPDPPWTFRRIRLRVLITGEVDEAKAARALVLSSEKSCSVHATLSPVVEIETEVEVRPV